MSRYANRQDAKRDGNETELVNEFKRLGFSVERLSTPLDLLVGYNEKTYLVEVKMPKGSFTKRQKEFIERWLGGYYVVRSKEDVQQFVNFVKEGVIDEGRD